jgi:hypothetical protein
VAVPESNGHATIAVTRSGNATGTQTVGYATSDGTATAADYTAASGTLTFGPGETSKTFAVPVTDDTADEPAETVSLSLSAPTGGSALGTASTGTLTIIDDDPAPLVAPPDTVKPQLLLALPSALRLRQALGGLRGRVSVSEACTLGLRMALGTKVLGTAAPGIAALGVRAFRVKFTAAGGKALKKRLKTRRTASLSLRATCTDAAHNAGAASARVSVTR